MFIEGFCLGSIIFIIAMVFIPWKSCGRQNIKVSELSTSTNTTQAEISAWCAEFNDLSYQDYDNKAGAAAFVEWVIEQKLSAVC